MADATDPSSLPDHATQVTVRDVIDDVLRRRVAGEFVPDEQVLKEHPELAVELQRELAKLRQIERARVLARQRVPGSDSAGTESGELAGIDGGESERVSMPRIAGYQLMNQISRGGQAVVYLALQESTGRRVAVKVMREGPFATSAERRRFDREVQVLATLDHPHIVSIIDRGIAQDGSHYFVMSLIDGSTLDVWLDNHRREQQASFDPAALLRLFVRICEAVEAAHERGIVHRDLKPANIRIDSRGEPHVLDFGLARPIVPDVARVPLDISITGSFIGSLPWASPEQARGEHDAIDARTDVYALGVILYQMLTGQFPYAVVGNMRDVLDNIMRAQPTPPSWAIEARGGTPATVDGHPAINPTIEGIVLKALSKSAADRYASAGELARDIVNYLEGRATSVAPLASEAGGRERRRRRVLFVTILVCCVAGAAAWLVKHVLRDGSGASAGSRLAATTQAAPTTTQPATTPSFEAFRHDAPVTGLAFSADGIVLASVGRDRHIRLWNMTTGRPIRSIPVTHDLGGVAISPDGTVVVAWAEGWYSGSDPARWSVSAFDPGSGQARRLVAHPQEIAGPVAFSPDRKTVVTGTPSGGARLWSVTDGLPIGKPFATGAVANCFDFSPDGTRLAAGNRDKVCEVWTVVSRKRLHAFDDLDRGGLFPVIHCVRFLDNKTLLAGVKANLIRYDVDAGEARDVGRLHAFAVVGISISSDSRWIATCGREGDGDHVIITDVVTGRRVRAIGSGKGANAVAFDPHGRYLITAGPGDEIQVWPANTWAQP